MRPLYLLLIILSGIHFFSMEKSYAQKKMSVHLQHKTLNDVLLTVQKNGRYYLYIDPSINTEKRISISTQYTDPVAFLQQIDNSLSYEIIDNTLVVTPQKDNAGRLFGLVLDENEQPVSGVVVHSPPKPQTPLSPQRSSDTKNKISKSERKNSSAYISKPM